MTAPAKQFKFTVNYTDHKSQYAVVLDTKEYHELVPGLK